MLGDIRDERVVAPDDIRDPDAEQKLFVSAAAITGFKRGGCCVDDHRNR